MAKKQVEVLVNLKKTGTGGKEAEQELSGVQKAAKMAGAALGAMATKEAVKAVYEFSKLGAQSIRTRDAFVAISGGADEAAKRLEAMQRATRGALSEQAAMSSANQLMQMGLANNAEELENVTNMAVRLGTAMGRDAGQSIEEFSLLLSNMSIPRLDTFGISAGKVRARINELQASIEGMTREEAFMIAVTEQGEEAMSRLGPATDDAMLASEQLEAAWADLKAVAAEQLAPAMAEIAGGLAKGMRSFQEQTTAVREYNRVLGEEATTSAYVAAHFQGQSGALADLQAQYEAATEPAQGLIQAEMDAAGAFGKYIREVEQAQTVSEAAAAAQYELATSAQTVAKSFGEMEFDDEELWKLAMASGATVEQLGALAQHLGIATDAEIQHTLSAYQMVEAFGRGELGAEQLASKFNMLSVAESDASIAGGKYALELSNASAQAARMADSAAATSTEMDKLRAAADLSEQQKAVEEAAGYFGDLEDATADTEDAHERLERQLRQTRTGFGRLDRSVQGTERSLAGAGQQAQNIKTYLDNIPEVIDVTVNVNYVPTGTPPPGTSQPSTPSGPSGHQAGTRFWGGGMALLGEGGPELAVLPRGSRVLPAWQTGQVVRQMTDARTWNRGGDTIVVQDALAAAMVLERQRRERDRRLVGGF